MMRRDDQQIKVTKIVASHKSVDEVRAKISKLTVYMCRNISIMMAISLHPSPSDQRPRRVGEAGSFCGIPSVRRLKYSTSD